MKESRLDARTALIAFTVAACSGAKKRDGTEFKLKDFMPLTPGEEEVEHEQTAEEMLAILESMVKNGDGR